MNIGFSIPFKIESYAESVTPKRLAEMQQAEIRIAAGNMFHLMEFIGAMLDEDQISNEHAAGILQTVGIIGRGFLEVSEKIEMAAGRSETILDLSNYPSQENGCLDLAKSVKSYLANNEDKSEIFELLDEMVSPLVQNADYSPEIIQVVVCSPKNAEYLPKLRTLIEGGKDA